MTTALSTAESSENSNKPWGIGFQEMTWQTVIDLAPTHGYSTKKIIVMKLALQHGPELLMVIIDPEQFLQKLSKTSPP